MSYFNERITLTLTAVEMDIVREALRYAAEQADGSEIPVFESFETLDRSTGEIVFNEDMYQANQDKAVLALELADTLDLIEAGNCDWEVLNCEAGSHVKRPISVWCRHHKTKDLNNPLVREFVWSYTPKQSALLSTVFTTVFTDHVVVHSVPYSELSGDAVIKVYELKDLQNRSPIITGDEDTDAVIAEALRNFMSYRG